MVNRLKIPQGLSTLLFHRWSEVPPRGEVHGILLSELFFLVVLLFVLAFCRGLFFSEWFLLGLLFLWPSSIWLLLLVFLFCLAFHKAPLILNASFFFFSDTFLCSALLVLFWLAFRSVSLLIVCFSGIVHMSQPVAVCFHTEL